MLYVGPNNCHQHYTLNNSNPGSHSNLTPTGEESDLGVMVNSQLKLHKHALLADANAVRHLGIIKRTFGKIQV